MSRIGRLVESFMIGQNAQSKVSFEEISIPSQSQILQMFQKNGFRSTNVITRNQLQQLFDRQYAMNDLDELGEKSQFSRQLFDELWDHLQLLSDSTAKIENISKVIHDALTQLQKKIKLIGGRDGITRKKQTLQQLIKNQQQLTTQLDLVDGQYEYHQQNIRSQRDTIRMSIGKLRAQINELERDKKMFQKEFRMMVLTIGVHESIEVEPQVILQQGIMSMLGIERKQYSSGLKFIFIVTVICIVMEMFILSYRVSFFNMLGLLCVLYVLFLGYYTDKSIVYLIGYFIVSILLDLAFAYMNIFITFILTPVVYTYNTFLKYIATVAVLVSLIARLILIIKLFSIREIPKNQKYFDFWGEEVLLNRRNKQFAHVHTV